MELRPARASAAPVSATEIPTATRGAAIDVRVPVWRPSADWVGATLKGIGPLSKRVPQPNDSDGGRDPLPPSDADVDDTPTVSCTRCGREWDVSYELDALNSGNRALEQFALDHKRHTGHFPDGVETWRANCLRCPQGVERLSESAVFRWGRTHARHTRHEVEIHHATNDETSLIDSE